MKLKIRLANLNNNGACASIESEDGILDVYESLTRRSPVPACMAAAQNLRLLADRFEALAKESDPFKAVTQDRINKPTK